VPDLEAVVQRPRPRESTFCIQLPREVARACSFSMATHTAVQSPWIKMMPLGTRILRTKNPLTDDSVERDIKVRDIEDNRLGAVVLRHPKSDGGRDRPVELGHRYICNALKACKNMMLMVAPRQLARGAP
jgi:hypothetical protein